MIVETDKSVLGESRESLIGYSQETTKIIDNSNGPEKEMENLLNAGRFRRMANRFYPNGLFQEDIELEASLEYYTKRKQGHKVAHSFRSAKFKAFHIALEYYQLFRSYEPQKDCDCDNCYYGRRSKCLNGIPVIRPKIDKISIDTILNSGQLVSELIGLEIPDKYQDHLWIRTQIKLLYDCCNDWRDKKIIDGKREGKTNKAIAESLGWKSENSIRNRLNKIGERFLAIDTVKEEKELTEINRELLKEYGLEGIKTQYQRKVVRQ